MALWLLAGAISAAVLVWDTGSLDFRIEKSHTKDNIISTIGISILITLCGYISFMCIGANYGIKIYRKIKDNNDN